MPKGYIWGVDLKGGGKPSTWLPPGDDSCFIDWGGTKGYPNVWGLNVQELVSAPSRALHLDRLRVPQPDCLKPGSAFRLERTPYARDVPPQA